MVLGLNYLSQELLTVVLSILYLMFVINYDNQILEFAEQLGFLARKAKKLKFQMMVICIIMLLVYYWVTLFSEGLLSSKLEWILNASFQESHCRQLLEAGGVTKLGVWFTFYGHHSYFYMIGISLGCSNYIVEVDNVAFVRSNWTKKFLRGLLGSILIGLFALL